MSFLGPSSRPSFHRRVGKAPQKQQEDEAAVPNHQWGYPTPGVQSPSSASVMGSDFFVSDNAWAQILDNGKYDYIVVGSGCTALAFIQEALAVDPRKKILCLERGDFLLPAHFQNLPLPFKMVLGGPSETFPWALSRKTFTDPELRYCHGSCPFFGGRSTFWSAWCPQPEINEMRDFPKALIAATQEDIFWPEANRLLHVTGTDELDNSIFAGLQDQVDSRLEKRIKDIPTATHSGPARLAVGRSSPTSTLRFNKFSTPGPLLKIYEDQKVKEKNGEGAALDIMLNCVVEKLHADEEGRVRSVKTSKGVISLPTDETSIVLCAGAFPNATLLLNSFDDAQETVGKRVTGHFLTHVVARVPLSSFGKWDSMIKDSDQPCKLEIAAHYLAGEDPKTKQQYHVQITAIHSPNPKEDADDAARECPDYAAAATEEQLKDSTKHVVFVCATLGEFSEHNEHNWLRPDKNNTDPTTNVKLQYTLADSDRELWNVMDEATYNTIEQMSAPLDGQVDSDVIEYWHTDDNGVNGYWDKTKPDVTDIRIPGIVHEASTAFVGSKEAGGSVDEYGRPHGIHNVHVTGGALFPTAGSWNPTLTMCGFTQHLARHLSRPVV
ncbi:unnamed protein product [Clonostachys rosea]|uniref:Glucose-methanol-choline oxidoreductase C-terminal domain-containing protein n=1 Tax=Bionectria ochroleuca TaxID=29856 RepID=A0ABY6TXB8_BIOOC|nr:unnamed protein product [Clonostachys rosea]